jgi:hypothetical protein
MPLLRIFPLALLGLTVFSSPGHPQAIQSSKLPPAPILLRWPEPAFERDVQCRGKYSVQELERFLPRARLGMSLPSTRAVQLNEPGRCITVTVDDIGTARLIELMLRGVAVPRRAVLLQLTARPAV